VVAVLRQPLGAEQREQLQRLLAAAVGASPERGDSVVVQALIAPPVSATAPAAPAIAAQEAREAATEAPAWSAWDALLVLAAGALATALALAMRKRAAVSRPAQVLDAAQRQAALTRVQAWMLQAEPVSVAAQKAGSTE
jgi:flagellar M-ring protein FliF